MIPACSVCTAPLLFTARQRGDGLCGRCSRIARGEGTPADLARMAKIDPEAACSAFNQLGPSIGAPTVAGSADAKPDRVGDDATPAVAELVRRIADLEREKRGAIVALLRVGRLTGVLGPEPWPADAVPLGEVIAERIEKPLGEIEIYERAARNRLAVELDRIDGGHSTSLADCAIRAAELLAIAETIVVHGPVPGSDQERELRVRIAELQRDPQPLELIDAEIRDPRDAARIVELETALRDLVARVRRVGGYATTEEQATLLLAEQLLAGGGT